MFVINRVLREIVIGWPQSGAENGVTYLVELGFNHEQADELAREIDAGAALDDIGVHPRIKVLLASMHTRSWFKLDGSDELLVVGKGGRQGCRFGGVLFNLAYAKALKLLHENANAEDIPIKLKHAQGESPDAKAEIAQDVIVFDVTFVDDEAIVITATMAVTLTRKFRRAVQLLIEAFYRYGMSINVKPGKTEAILIDRGKNVKREKDHLFTSESDACFSVYLGREEEVRINIVPQYKHLGSIITTSGSLVPEARQRVRSAMNAFAPLAKTLSSKSVSLQRRIMLGWSLVASRLFYNVHVWSRFAGKARTTINVMYMRIWRKTFNDHDFNERSGRTKRFE